MRYNLQSFYRVTGYIIRKPTHGLFLLATIIVTSKCGGPMVTLVEVIWEWQLKSSVIFKV